MIVLFDRRRLGDFMSTLISDTRHNAADRSVTGSLAVALGYTKDGVWLGRQQAN